MRRSGLRRPGTPACRWCCPVPATLDVSYVGSHNFNSVAFGAISIPTNELPMDQNAPDAGTAYLPAVPGSDARASTVPGAAAYTTDLLRPYRGLGAINTTWPDVLDAVRFDAGGAQPAVPQQLAGRPVLDDQFPVQGQHLVAPVPGPRSRRHVHVRGLPEGERRTAVECRPAAAHHQDQRLVGGARGGGGLDRNQQVPGGASSTAGSCLASSRLASCHRTTPPTPTRPTART